MKVLVTGGCGYIGSVLVPKLLQLGHEVWVVDVQWFGNALEPHPQLGVTKADYRTPFALDGVGAVIHLAAIANDPGGDLNPKLTWEVNALGTAQLLDACAHAGVKHFIYASSGSVYGVNDSPEITEWTPLDPLTEYNKTKMVAERVCLSYADQMAVQILRPATVCGWSPRQRLDVIINRQVNEALNRKKIMVLGGTQIRPHISIEDMTNLYVWMLARPEVTGIFNAGFQNLSVMESAEMVSAVTGAPIEFVATNDPRSYRMNSDRLLGVGFRPRCNVMDVIKELLARFYDDQFKDEDKCYNLKTMQALKVA